MVKMPEMADVRGSQLGYLELPGQACERLLLISAVSAISRLILHKNYIKNSKTLTTASPRSYSEDIWLSKPEVLRKNLPLRTKLPAADTQI
jgi:hypothetical protein